MLKASKYLRISLTNKCNLSCFFCHKEGNDCSQQEELSLKELQLACRVAVNMGYQKFKLTGGEPTLHSNICTIISMLSELEIPDLSMVTNGTTLSELAADLWNSGLHRVNVTLNTLRQDRFLKIQKKSNVSVQIIQDGILTAKSVGFNNIKINFVYFDEDSEQDLRDLLAFVKECNCTLVVLPAISAQSYYTLDFLYNTLRSYGISREEIIYDAEGIRKRLICMNSGASVLLRMDELVDKKPYVFCDKCEDYHKCREGIFPIRLSANGELIPCMASKNYRISIRTALLSEDEKAICQAFTKIEDWC